MDEESGLIYLRARYYDPGTGRFTQEDAAKDGANWYAYCGNDSVNRIDVSGLYYMYIKDMFGYDTHYEFKSTPFRKSTTVYLPTGPIQYVIGVNGTKIYNDRTYIWVKPDTGAASPHRQISGGSAPWDLSPNCYTYAIMYNSKPMDPGQLGNYYINYKNPYSVYDLANAVIADLGQLGRSARILKGIDGDVNWFEYRIAHDPEQNAYIHLNYQYVGTYLVGPAN